MNEFKIAILGDSRTFDTYYYNSQYPVHYGYDKTFTFILQKLMRTSSSGKIDVVHIPDHFRSKSIENNILRLALIDPSLIILCNGIWETLLNKQSFAEYAMEKINAHQTREGGELKLTYSSRALADLFKSDQLPSSPKKYLAEQKQVVSYFRRRQRHCVLMTLPVSPPTHLDRLHYAGNYRCIPEWGECLEALNDVIKPLVQDYGAVIVDTHSLVVKNGGFEKNLIDQWHFSVLFHALLADYFRKFIESRLNLFDLPENHVSHEFMLHREIEQDTLLIYGTGDIAAEWIKTHPKVRIEALVGENRKGSRAKSIPVIQPADLKNMKSRIVLLIEPEESRQITEIKILRDFPKDKILLYPEELESSYYKSLKGMM